MESKEMDFVISLLRGQSYTINNTKKEHNDPLNQLIIRSKSNFPNLKIHNPLLPDIGQYNPLINHATIQSIMTSKPKFNMQYNKFKDLSKASYNHKESFISSTDSSFMSNGFKSALRFNNTRIRYLNFRPYIDMPLIKEPSNSIVRYYYKMIGNECLLIKNLLEDNGFLPCSNNSNEWTILWSSGHINLKIFPTLTKYQKVNHFPRSNELTRKDLLYKNLSKLISAFPNSRLNFLPMSFLLPNELSFLEDEIKRTNSLFIIKPVASSQGRGIFLTDSTHDIPSGQNLIASRYINNPFLINGFKFDLRIYVFVTSILPLRIYRFKEGLVRFASDKYSDNYNDRCSHLTNYAVNKGNKNYIKNNDPETDFKSSKWNLTGFKEFLDKNNINSEVIFNKIDDIIIKTLISVENSLLTAFKKYSYNTNSCFELFGFDILLDDQLNPWLIEVNLSPNLHYDAPIDLKIKGEMLAECFDLMRVLPYDLRKGNAISTSVSQSNCDYMSIKALRSMKITKDIKEAIWETNEEMNRLKQFKRIFPTERYCEYRKFFDEEREINVILAIIEAEKASNYYNKNTIV